MKTAKFFGTVTLFILLVTHAANATSYRRYSGWSGDGDSSTTLTIKADGSSVLSTETTQPRKMLEYQIRTQERYARMAESMEDDEAITPNEPATESETPGLSTDDLSKKIREMYEKQSEITGEENAGKLETLEVSTNDVRMVWNYAFGSLSELMSVGLWRWGPTLLLVEDARFETKTNGQFEISFTPARIDARYLKTMTQQLKARKVKQGWKLVLPGRIVTSSLPGTKDNTTWLALDTSKPESVEALLKLIGTNLTIVAESGGLKLETALDARTAMWAARSGARDQSNLAITEAGPGFITEPVSLTISTIYHFPGNGKERKDLPSYSYGMQSTGTVVTAKLFPPKGRTIQSVSEVRVLQAKDDKGRTIAVVGADEDSSGEGMFSETVYSHGGRDHSGAARLDLRLGLPEGDAQAIDEVQAEAVVSSLGSWKEMTLANVQADATKEIDLGEVLPGAKMIITKIITKTSQITVQARLEGPTAVNQLEVKLKLSNEESSSNMSERRNRTAGGKTTRSVTVQGYEFNPESGGAPAATSLIVRIPQDLKRERVQFKLTALDLL